jgi:hypothetical protein
METRRLHQRICAVSLGIDRSGEDLFVKFVDLAGHDNIYPSNVRAY